MPLRVSYRVFGWRGRLQPRPFLQPILILVYSICTDHAVFGPIVALNMPTCIIIHFVFQVLKFRGGGGRRGDPGPAPSV
jgi:hypothetical protein